MKRREEEVGDLFVTEGRILLKLLPSKKSAARPIRWFSKGLVTDHRGAVQDISRLVDRLRRPSSVVRGLTLMTDRGLGFDLEKSGLARAVQRAGFRLLN